MRIYSIYDSKMQQYDQQQMLLHVNDETMKRALSLMIPREHPMVVHGEDYFVRWMGAISLETGVIASQVPVDVCSIRELFPLTGGENGAR